MHRRILIVLAVAVIGSTIAFGAAPAVALGLVPDSGVDSVRGKVFALAETADHSTLYVGGKFSRVSGQEGQHAYFPTSLARIDESTGLGDPTWTPSVLASDGIEPGLINAIAVSPDGQTVYIGGKFATVDGQPRKNFAAISAYDGSVQPISENISKQVDTILLASSGGVVSKIYIGGPFKIINNHPYGGLAALNPDGTIDTSFTPSADSTVRTLVYSADGQTIFAGGSFDSITQGGTTYPREAVARLNLDGTVNDWTIPAGTIPSPMTAWSLSPTADALYGGFGNKNNFAAAFHLDTGSVGGKIWLKGTKGNVEGTALDPDGTGLFISGHFGTNNKKFDTACPGEPIHGVAEMNRADGTYRCWAPTLLPDLNNAKGGWTMLANSTQLWVGGVFDQICSPDLSTCVPPGPPGTTSLNLARFTL